jgi:hypothetical protein
VKQIADLLFQEVLQTPPFSRDPREALSTEDAWATSPLRIAAKRFRDFDAPSPRHGL